MVDKRSTAVAVVLALLLTLLVPASASAHGRDDDRHGRRDIVADPTDTFGSVEPIANPAVFDTTALGQRSLAVKEAFAERVLECGVVDRVIDALDDADAIDTINRQNTTFDVGAGGFQGRTSPAITFVVDDSGRGAASHDDITVLANSLGYVFSQFSAFLLDGDGPTSFDFGAGYLILDFRRTPSLERSAQLFEAVGAIDPELFETDSSGYTQYGRSYLTLQSAVSDEQFIAGYATVAEQFGLAYRPIIDGQPGLYQGGAAFPANDWTAAPDGAQYLSRVPAAAHPALATIRAHQLGLTASALELVERSGDGPRADRHLVRALDDLGCRPRHAHEDRVAA